MASFCQVSPIFLSEFMQMPHQIFQTDQKYPIAIFKNFETPHAPKTQIGLWRVASSRCMFASLLLRRAQLLMVELALSAFVYTGNISWYSATSGAAGHAGSIWKCLRSYTRSYTVPRLQRTTEL